MAAKRKGVGILKNVDSIGRIVIPKELRTRLGIEKDDTVEIIEDGNRLILRRYRPRCVYCDGTKRLIGYKGKYTCRMCLEAMSKALYK